MRRIIWPISVGLVVVSIGMGLLLASCESAPPAAERKPQSRPVATEKENTPSTAPAGPAVATPPPVAEPAPTPPPAAEQKPPDYITVIERFEPQQRAAVEARREDGNRLVIDTRNVRRMRIDRTRAELNLRRSVALQIDGQGLEWLPKSDVTEFERSVNGAWTPVKPVKP
jgi:hypothetical protein